MGIATPRPVARDSRVGVADALFTKGQQRVLGILFGNPDRSYYANEIIKAAGAGTGAVQRELAKLESAGLVTATRVGKQKHYQANRAAPVFAELHGLVIKTAGLADVVRSALASVSDAISAAFIFGSVAKRTEKSASDIDLLVVSDTLSYADLFELLGIAEQRLDRKINPQVYTRGELARRRRTGNAFVTRVLAQPKLWLIGNERALSA